MLFHLTHAEGHSGVAWANMTRVLGSERRVKTEATSCREAPASSPLDRSVSCLFCEDRGCLLGCVTRRQLPFLTGPLRL